LFVNLQPDRSPEELAAAWNEAGISTVATRLGPLAPARAIEALLRYLKLDGSTRSDKLERKARNRLLETVSSLPLGSVRAVPLEKGEVVAGGISLDEVDPQTMASKLTEGLFL
ncbi:MAG: hypothetical protein C4320_08395, partial [Armatimonadota bacterium]